MVKVAHQWFDGVGYRGLFTLGGESRCTLSRFDDPEEAELWALKLLLRWKSVYAVEG